MKNDLIVWFDSKTGESMNNKDKFINEVQEIANKYDFDFFMCGSPKNVKNHLSFIDFDFKEQI